MYEEYQVEIPQSFLALFVDPGRSKPNAPRNEVAARYELCEDLANMLSLQETWFSAWVSLNVMSLSGAELA